jgi:hypothetical protein
MIDPAAVLLERTDRAGGASRSYNSSSRCGTSDSRCDVTHARRASQAEAYFQPTMYSPGTRSKRTIPRTAYR